MNVTLPIRKCVYLLAVLLFASPAFVVAQGSLTLSVTPTLFEISVEPGQTWRSNVRVINANPHDITVYAEPVNFTATGETGVGSFASLSPNGEGVTLGEWIVVDREGVTIPAQQTAEIPFTVPVPSDAAPGGQFAALLISTQPPVESEQGSRVRTTQAVSTLFFMRIEGDVIEQGQVRSFRATNGFVQRPENTFELRFENQGTVHLQPQGDITIYNMWGERRGEIPINQRSQFGKVLPDTIRAFTFGWEGEYSLLDIGRYRAEVTLAYGDSNRSFTNSTAYFWVIPIYGLLIVLGSLVVFGLLVAFMVRSYVRRVLALSGVEPGRRRVPVLRNDSDVDLTEPPQSSLPVSQRPQLLAPLRAVGSDIVTRWHAAPSLALQVRTLREIVRDYRVIVVAVCLLVLAGISLLVFIQIGLTENRAFEVVVDNQADGVRVSSEELEYQRLVQAGVTPDTSRVAISDLEPATTTPSLSIVNVSGVSGAAAAFRIALEERGYEVVDLSTDLNRIESRSIIVYDQTYQADALQLSRALNGALLSARPGESLAGVPMVLYLGTDVTSP